MKFWGKLFKGIGVGLVFFIPIALLVDMILAFGLGIKGTELQTHWTQSYLVAWGLICIMGGIKVSFDEVKK